MAMNKSALASSIKQALINIKEQSSAIPALSSAIKSYIEENCVVIYSWGATTPPPYPPPPIIDPIVTFNASVSFPSFKLSVPAEKTVGPAMSGLSDSVTSQVDSANILAPAGFTIPPMKFGPGSIMLTASNATDQTKALEHLADEIINGIKTKINPSPIAGVHAAFTIPAPGATMTSIQ